LILTQSVISLDGFILTGPFQHGRNWDMKFLSFISTVIALSAPALAFAFPSISGQVVSQGDQVIIQLDGTSSTYTLIPQSTDVTTSLARLNIGDEVYGTGQIDDFSDSIQLQSLDYVGLKGLLGTWRSPEGLMEVKDFSNLSFHPSKDDTALGGDNSRDNVNYKYSLAPADNSEWVVFLSIPTKTTFATVELADTLATLKIYDANTGAIKSTLHLQKRSAP